MTAFRLDRRRFVSGLTAASGLTLSGCDVMDSLSDPDNAVRNVLERANDLTFGVQRLLGGGHKLAREYAETEIRQAQRPNGVTRPDDGVYRNLLDGGFADWRLEITGLVEGPQSFRLDDLRNMPPKTQITRHDCVEGWSCIAKWTGVPLGFMLDLAVPKPTARFVVFHCMDTIERSLGGEVKYYGSIDLIDAWHPQTILAYGLNGAPLPVQNGAPLRARVERQLGYKMPKYLRGIELVDSFASMGRGQGGYWEDRGYDWFGGI